VQIKVNFAHVINKMQLFLGNNAMNLQQILK